MIIDTIENASKYFNTHPLFAQAFAFIAANPEPASGTTELSGKDLYAIVSRTDGEPPKPPKLEAHRKYIDIQLALAGSFDIGWKPLASCQHISKAYDEENDYVLYEDESDVVVTLQPGMFGVFFPDDAHAPMSSQNPLTKMVFKVRV